MHLLFLCLVVAPGLLLAGPSRWILEYQRVSGRSSAERAVVRRHLSERAIPVITEFQQVFDGVVIEAEPEDVARLMLRQDVRRVYREIVYQPQSDRVAPLHRVAAAWQRAGSAEQAGAGMKIAILDTGIDQTHVTMQNGNCALPEGFPRASSAANWSYTNCKVIVARSYEQFNANVTGFGIDASDRKSHGTGVAMLAAGAAVETTIGPVQGVAPGAWLGNYKVMGTAGGTNSGILKALDDAVADGMDVINLSLGSSLAPDPANDPLVAAIERATQMGVIVVAAAGNFGAGASSVQSPAHAPSAIAVGAHRSDRSLPDAWGKRTEQDPGELAVFSSRGPNTGSAIKPDLVAVGESLLVAQSTLLAGSDGWVRSAGTSLAAPIVSGAAALLKALRPGLRAADYGSLLINSAAPLGLLVREAGSGRLDVEAALRASLTAEPASLRESGVFRLMNLESEAFTVTLRVEPVQGPAPLLSTLTLRLEPGESAAVELTVDALEGEAQGWIVAETEAGAIRVPYWHGNPTGRAAGVTVLDCPKNAARNTTVSCAVRVVDEAGLPVWALPYVQTLASGAVSRVEWLADAPAIANLQLRIAAGQNRFRVAAGAASAEVSINGL